MKAIEAIKMHKRFIVVRQVMPTSTPKGKKYIHFSLSSTKNVLFDR